MGALLRVTVAIGYDKRGNNNLFHLTVLILMKLESGRVTVSQSLLKLSSCVNPFGFWMLIVARVWLTLKCTLGFLIMLLMQL